MIYLCGGPPHQETFDLKPEAPLEYRGEFRPIPTTVPGLDICEHLPLLAKQAHHLAVINSIGEQPVLPVQDGRGGYGNGLGLMTLARLDDAGVRFERPRPVKAGAAWPGRGIHTLNRAGQIEVVDSVGTLRR